MDPFSLSDDAESCWTGEEINLADYGYTTNLAMKVNPTRTPGTANTFTNVHWGELTYHLANVMVRDQRIYTSIPGSKVGLQRGQAVQLPRATADQACFNRNEAAFVPRIATRTHPTDWRGGGAV